MEEEEEGEKERNPSGVGAGSATSYNYVYIDKMDIKGMSSVHGNMTVWCCVRCKDRNQ